jgi:hypothetical protein
MSQVLQLNVSEALFTALAQKAESESVQPETVAIRLLEDQLRPIASKTDDSTPSEFRRMFGAAALGDNEQAQFEQCFGTWDLGHPIGSDNEQIDTDVSALVFRLRTGCGQDQANA